MHQCLVIKFVTAGSLNATQCSFYGHVEITSNMYKTQMSKIIYKQEQTKCQT